MELLSQLRLIFKEQLSKSGSKKVVDISSKVFKSSISEEEY